MFSPSSSCFGDLWRTDGRECSLMRGGADVIGPAVSWSRLDNYATNNIATVSVVVGGGVEVARAVLASSFGHNNHVGMRLTT
jgi:hypothetical protein